MWRRRGRNTLHVVRPCPEHLPADGDVQPLRTHVASLASELEALRVRENRRSFAVTR